MTVIIIVVGERMVLTVLIGWRAIVHVGELATVDVEILVYDDGRVESSTKKLVRSYRTGLLSSLENTVIEHSFWADIVHRDSSCG